METQKINPQKPGEKAISLRVLDGQTELAEEDLRQFFEFFSKWSKEIFYTVAIIAAVFFVTKFLRETDLKQRKIASTKYEQTRTVFKELQTALAAPVAVKPEDQVAQAKKIDELKIQLSESIKVLGDAKEPYKSFGLVYRSLSSNLLGDIKDAQTELASLNLDSELAAPKSENLYAELIALNCARTLLDTDATFQDGWSVLLKLVSKGTFSATNAATALVDVARNAAEKDAAKTALTSLMQRRPETSQFVEPLLKRLS